MASRNRCSPFGTAVSTCDTILPMTSPELTLQIIAFGLAWWLGLYLISRNPRSVRLLLAGLGLVTYSVGLALELLARFASSRPLVDTLLGWQRPFMYLPVLLWLGLLITETRSEISWQNRLRRQPRSASTLIAATIFFALGFGFMLFPLNWLPRLWLLLGIGLDLLLLGIAIAFFDAFDEGETLLPHFLKAFDYALLTALVFGGQVALVMVLSTGVSFPMLLLLLTTIGAAIVIQVFAGAAQILADRIAFSPFPQIRQQRATLRAVDEASQRVDSRRSPNPSDAAEFSRLTRRALSQMGNLPKLAASPLTRLPIIEQRLNNQGVLADTLSRAAELKVLLVESVDRLKPQNQGDFGSTDEWRHYNALYFPYVVGLKPYSRRSNQAEMETAVQQAYDWFRQEIPQRTLYNWQNAAAKLVAQDIRDQSAITNSGTPFEKTSP